MPKERISYQTKLISTTRKNKRPEWILKVQRVSYYGPIKLCKTLRRRSVDLDDSDSMIMNIIKTALTDDSRSAEVEKRFGAMFFNKLGVKLDKYGWTQNDNI